MSAKQTVAYGFWKSPVTPSMMGGRLRFGDVQWDSDGRSLVWLEGRSDRGVLICRQGDDAPYDLTDEHSVRAGVGYGGGDFTVARGFVIFADKNGRLYRQSLEPGRASAITPEFGNAASPVVSSDGRWVLYVHSYERTDGLGLVDSNGAHWPIALVTGADFYMQPVWHPSGDLIAWIEWDHPCMPWDGTRLKTGRVSGNPLVLAEETFIAGDVDKPVFQPAFSPDGKWLSYIITEDDWDRLIVLNPDTRERRVLVEGATLAEPAWSQGVRVYGWSADSTGIFYHRNDQGFGSLWRAEVASGHTTQIDIDPYAWLQQIAVSPAQDTIACVASSPSMPDRVVTREAARITVHRRSSSEMVAQEDLPTPRPITWSAPDGATVHGLYYPPTNSRFDGAGKPPAIVNIHGGPTGQRTAAYAPETGFFTSRGYAVLEVNYRGSTGYGRAYMLALREHWGVYDTEDAVGGAQALVDRGLADPERVVIKGGSAGGYTVLNALIHHPGVFRAGLCLYGVTNLFTLATDTHKFEERYLDSMVGPLPETGARYRAWSPIFHADKIRDPIAIFQGTEDKVVLPNQSESIVKVLQGNGVPYIYRLYDGEGHGWRKTETIVAFYNDLERFLKQYVLIG